MGHFGPEYYTNFAQKMDHFGSELAVHIHRNNQYGIF